MRDARRVRHGRADQGDPRAGAGSSDRSCDCSRRGCAGREQASGRQEESLEDQFRRGNCAAISRPLNKEECMQTTWQPHTEHGDLTTRSNLPESAFAFPEKRKEPLTDASHVRNALARFDQVDGVSDADRDLAFANIKKAAAHYGVEIQESSWQELGKQPHTKNNAKH